MVRKRTFVWFFCLMQSLALLLFSEQSMASYKLDFPAKTTTYYDLDTQEEATDFEICEDDCEDESPIIKADECEWKEGLTDLLRHRHSSYRFISFESSLSSFFDFIVGQQGIKTKSKAFSAYLTIKVLPDYYSFLHRLCPF